MAPASLVPVYRNANLDVKAHTLLRAMLRRAFESINWLIRTASARMAVRAFVRFWFDLPGGSGWSRMCLSTDISATDDSSSGCCWKHMSARSCLRSTAHSVGHAVGHFAACMQGVHVHDQGP
jgi:hypothetical protein